MCGIMGYVGSGEAWDIVIGGLRAARVPWLRFDGHRHRGGGSAAGRAQRSGHLSALRDANPDGLPGHVGHRAHAVGLPTAAVTVDNCHPHCDSKPGASRSYTNGIIDNVEALRAELLADGVVFPFRKRTRKVLAELVGRGPWTAGLTLKDAGRGGDFDASRGPRACLALDRLDPETAGWWAAPWKPGRGRPR